MSDALTEDEYRSEVDGIAERLIEEATEAVDNGEYDAVMDAVYEWVSEELDYHNWFARTYYDGALYGSIIGYAESDTGRYSDWQALIEADTPKQTHKRLAYVVMEGDVLAEAHSRVE